MKIVEKRIFPVKVTSYCEKCDIPMDREHYERAEHTYSYLYRCPYCNATEISKIMYPYIKYVEE